MNTEFTIREYHGKADRKALELIGLPAKYIRQYTNAPPLYYALKVLAICTNELYLMSENATGKIVGTILVRQRLNPFEVRYDWKIHAVYVAPELRGRGFGVALVSYALQKSGERRAKEVSLKVDGNNDAAIRLYKKCGFVEKIRTHNQIIFIKQLA